MPALKMKAKSCTGCLKEGNSLRVCHMSCKISKKSCSQVRTYEHTAELDTPSQDCQNVSSNTGLFNQEIESGLAIHFRELFDGDTVELQKSSLFLIDPESAGRTDFLSAMCPSSLETIFSPLLDSKDGHCKPNIHNYAGMNDDLDVPQLTADDSDDGSSSSCGNQTCNVSDYYISDLSVACLDFEENTRFDDIMEVNPFPDFESTSANMVFNMAEKYMLPLLLEETTEISNTHDGKSCEEAIINPDDACLCLVINQMQPCDPKPDINSYSDSDEVDCFDPQLFIRNLPDLYDVGPTVCPVLLPKETRKRNPITLVLDLDETLVHSTLEQCNDADFTFPVFFNLKENTVYVRQRPYLRTFLERVSDMFEIIVFTASQRIYAERLLNILDPERKLFLRRVYRESCIFSDGSYTKDLTVLGVDLAKIAIIDNSPQVFRLQVNNGIPIKSWFDDPSDHALISLLPFLETLVDTDDVRPIIAKKFSNKE